MIDVMIITFNEALNLPFCLKSLSGWTNKIFVIDSGSTDETEEITHSFGAHFIHNDWPGYAAQKNWGLDNIKFESDWVLIIDADEVITNPLRKQIQAITVQPVDQIKENGFFLNRLTYFLDKPIRHCGYYPSWNMRLFKRGMGRYEKRPVHEHVIINEPLGYLKQPMLHNDRRGLGHYMAKHNRYSSLEAQALLSELKAGIRNDESVALTKSTRRRRWLKRKLFPKLPVPGIWRFLYMYFFRLGILDGRAGLAFCRFIAMYDDLVSWKIRSLKNQEDHITWEGRPVRIEPSVEAVGGLAHPEGTLPSLHTSPTAVDVPVASKLQMQPEASPWTLRDKILRTIWIVIGRPLFRISFHNWYRFRSFILRCFGGKIAKGVAIRPTVHIEVPWMLDIEEDATIGDHAILYSLGMIKIGKRSIISQYAHLCAGTHDYQDHTFRLQRTPISIGQDVWIGADSFVGPGVVIGDLSVVGARSSVYKDLPSSQVCVGNPAKPLKERILK